MWKEKWHGQYWAVLLCTTNLLWLKERREKLSSLDREDTEPPALAIYFLPGSCVRLRETMWTGTWAEASDYTGWPLWRAGAPSDWGGKRGCAQVQWLLLCFWNEKDLRTDRIPVMNMAGWPKGTGKTHKQSIFPRTPLKMSILEVLLDTRDAR